MNETNNQLIQAIDTIITSRLNDLAFDNTIVCEILKVSEDKAEYIVSTGTSTFTAYGDREYFIGQKVYVTIPQNNYSLKKIIVGSYTAENTIPYEYTNPFDRLVDITGNLAAAGSQVLEVMANGDTQVAAADEINLSNLLVADTFGEPDYIGLQVTFETNLDQVTTGRYGIRLTFVDNSGQEHEYVFDSTELYGNPYYYDAPGFAHEKIFAYPEGIQFTKCNVELYQLNNFNLPKELPEDYNETIKASNFYICFGYDKNSFTETKFNISTNDNDTYDINGENIKTIKASLVHFNKETKNVSRVQDLLKYNLSWYRYKVGNDNVGGGAHWEQLFMPTNENQAWFNKPQGIDKYKYEYAFNLYRLLEIFNREKENYDEEQLNKQKEQLDKQIEIYNKYFNAEKKEEEKVRLESNENKIVIINLIPKEEIINLIEQPINTPFTSGAYIGKNSNNQYCLTSFPNTAYQTDKIKATIVFEDKNLTSDILTFTLNQPGGSSTEDENSDINKAIVLEFDNNSGYYPVYDSANNKIIPDYNETHSISATFADGGDWLRAKTITWKYPTNSLIDPIVSSSIKITTSGDWSSYTIEQTIEDEGISNCFNYKLKENYSPSLNIAYVYCYVNGEECSDKLKLWFGNYGSSGTDFTLYLTDDNGQEPWKVLHHNDNFKALVAHLKDPEGKEIEFSKDVYWEWLYNFDANATTIEISIDDAVPYKKRANFKIKDFKKYCNAILKVSYLIQVTNSQAVELIKYHPIAATNIEEAERITGAFEVVYDTNGNVANYDDSYYNIILSGIEETPKLKGEIISNLQSVAVPTLFLESIRPPLENNISYCRGGQSSHSGQFYDYCFNEEPLKVPCYIALKINNWSEDQGLAIVELANFEDTSADNANIKNTNLIYYDEHYVTTETTSIKNNWNDDIHKVWINATNVDIEKDQSNQVCTYYFKINIFSNDTANNINNDTANNINNATFNGLRVHMKKETSGIEAYYYYPRFKLKTNNINSLNPKDLPWVCNNITLIKNQNKKWQQPVHLRYNQYGTKFLNDWDGTLMVDEENNAVLSSLLVAGEKNYANQFTGVVIGDVEKVNEDATNSLYGVYGFKEGVRSFSLDEEGSFFVGNSNGSLSFDKNANFNLDCKGSNLFLQANGLVIDSKDTYALTIENGGKIAAAEFVGPLKQWTEETVKIDTSGEGARVFDIGTGYASSSTSTSTISKGTVVEISSFSGNINLVNGGTQIKISNRGNEAVWLNRVWRIDAPYGTSITFNYYLSTNYGWSEPYVGFCYGEPKTDGIYNAQDVTILRQGYGTKTFSGGAGWYFFLNYPVYNLNNSNATLQSYSPTTYSVQNTETTNNISGHRFQVENNGQTILVQPQINGSTITSTISLDAVQTNSDRNLKHEIIPLESTHLDLLKNLEPVSYKYNDGTSNRKHTGFIAQQVEDSMDKVGLTSQDFAALTINKDTGNYALRYEEFIALNTLAIQDLYKTIEYLQSRIVELEDKLKDKDT